eukprot:scaffold6279_cov418-Prasinococcus_capsulatus_cf.AAC.6
MTHGTAHKSKEQPGIAVPARSVPAKREYPCLDSHGMKAPVHVTDLSLPSAWAWFWGSNRSPGGPAAADRAVLILEEQPQRDTPDRERRARRGRKQAYPLLRVTREGTGAPTCPRRQRDVRVLSDITRAGAPLRWGSGCGVAPS